MRDLKALLIVLPLSLVLTGCGDVTVNPPSKTVIVEKKEERPVVIEKTIERPVIVEKTVVEKPIVVEKNTDQKPVIIDIKR